MMVNIITAVIVIVINIAIAMLTGVTDVMIFIGLDDSTDVIEWCGCLGWLDSTDLTCMT